MTAVDKPRRRQSILASFAHYYEQHEQLNQSFVLYPIRQWMEEVHRCLVTAEREFLEYSPQFRQLLPYQVLRRPRGNTYEYLTYQRTTKIGEERLGKKYSIGWGGHIDAKDIHYNGTSVVNLANTLYNASKRELNEELRGYFNMNEGPYVETVEEAIEGYIDTAFLVDNTTPTETVHVGICNILQVYEGFDFECREDELIMVGWKTLEELSEEGQFGQLEVWSQILVRNLHQTQTKAYLRIGDKPFFWDEVYGPIKIQNSSLSGTFVAQKTTTDKTKDIKKMLPAYLHDLLVRISISSDMRNAQRNATRTMLGVNSSLFSDKQVDSIIDTVNTSVIESVIKTAAVDDRHSLNAAGPNMIEWLDRAGYKFDNETFMFGKLNSFSEAVRAAMHGFLVRRESWATVDRYVACRNDGLMDILSIGTPDDMIGYIVTKEDATANDWVVHAPSKKTDPAL